jgi:hypothetical protein
LKIYHLATLLQSLARSKKTRTGDETDLISENEPLRIPGNTHCGQKGVSESIIFDALV